MGTVPFSRCGVRVRDGRCDGYRKCGFCVCVGSGSVKCHFAEGLGFTFFGILKGTGIFLHFSQCLPSPKVRLWCFFRLFLSSSVADVLISRQPSLPKLRKSIMFDTPKSTGEGSMISGDLPQNDGMEHEGHHQHVAGSGTAEGFSREGSRDGSDTDGRNAKASSLSNLLLRLDLIDVALSFRMQANLSLHQSILFVPCCSPMIRTYVAPAVRRQIAGGL